MIDFLTSPLSDSAAARPALFWILGITLVAIGSVLMRDGWRWFIALGKAAENPIEPEADIVEADNVAAFDTVPSFVASPFDRRNPATPSTGFGRRRTDRIGLAQSA